MASSDYKLEKAADGSDIAVRYRKSTLNEALDDVDRWLAAEGQPSGHRENAKHRLSEFIRTHSPGLFLSRMRKQLHQDWDFPEWAIDEYTAWFKAIRAHVKGPQWLEPTGPTDQLDQHIERMAKSAPSDDDWRERLLARAKGHG